jgi:hypothetical protein
LNSHLYAQHNTRASPPARFLGGGGGRRGKSGDSKKIGKKSNL